MSEWKTIESAPKDGTEILIFKAGWEFAPVAKWGFQDCEGVDEQPACVGGWMMTDDATPCGACEEGFIGWNEDVEEGVMPTHWQPLPAPPIGEQ